MKVDALELEDFRNYRRLEAAFSPGVNVIYGENAQGKTNLLESIAYLSTASSHRARYDRELIRLGPNLPVSKRRWRLGRESFGWR